MTFFFILASSEVPRPPNVSPLLILSRLDIPIYPDFLKTFFFNSPPVPRPSLTLTLTLRAFLPPQVPMCSAVLAAPDYRCNVSCAVTELTLTCLRLLPMVKVSSAHVIRYNPDKGRSNETTEDLLKILQIEPITVH